MVSMARREFFEPAEFDLVLGDSDLLDAQLALAR
jgi:hypothetical protein